MKTKVLIATYYWPPSGGAGVQRYLKFAKYLSRFDIEPIILTVKNPTYPIQDPTLGKDLTDPVQVFKTKTLEPFGIYAGLAGKKPDAIKPTTELKGDNFISKAGSWIRANLFIPDARVGWLLTAKRKAEELIRLLDIRTIITTGPPHSVHFIGKHVQKHTGVQWFADFRDPWTDIYYNQILPRTKLTEQIDKRLEKSVLRSADEIIVVTNSQAEQFRQIEERAYHVITNGFDPDDFKQIQQEPSHPPPFLIRHTGSIGEAAIPVGFLKAIQQLSADKKTEVKVEFIGHVHHKLPETVRQLGLEQIVSFRNYLPHLEALKEMVRAHILLLCLPDVPDIRHHIPGKLFEYFGSGTPILLLGPEDGDAARIVRDQQAGVICPFNDVESIKNGIESLCNRPPAASRKRADRHHPYSRLQLTESLASLIRNQQET